MTRSPTPPRRTVLAGGAALLALGAAACKPKETTGPGEKTAAPLLTDATDAYVYGYPLVTMDTTRRVMTNVAAAETSRAPAGQFANMRTYPDASFRDVTAPNADTLYSSAWLDVGREPVILQIPDEHGRYFLMPMLDGWTNVFQSPGKRTTGTGPQSYLISGPAWSGAVPAGVTQYKSPTDMVWILGRTYSSGTPQDYAEVHKIQDQLKLVPLSAWGQPYAPPAGVVDTSVDMKTPPRTQVESLSGQAFFQRMAELLKTNPPAAADAPMVARLAKIGIVPGQAFDAARLDAATADQAKAAALKRISEHLPKAGKEVNGWTFASPTGQYGTDYLQRAFIAQAGLGANLPQDAIYPTAKVDANNQAFDASINNYVIRFPKDGLPPVNGFWSITMYDPQYFFVANPLNRFTISARDKLKQNPDGTTDVYVQARSPGPDKASNWLPAPSGPFILMARTYWPKQAMIDGGYALPGVAVSGSANA
ncbi:DUF1254 domain-containing protein [Caulobacter sp. 17J80-11]|uniref:DUF1254 domain-containing protein n=1 Tax=Caulobacter sp. 17J80-11 TaxID=2763502 RepID=UPI0016534BEE|nr:DUF1254 domain-containing protein [Caulobacter sp. 17J80-11]MBC6982177.1 DUF1254 domain-containing protein [Caulobacter sp. 17J80-11]